MAESTSTRGGRRPRRSTRVSQRLQHARERNAAQLAAQRDREQRVEKALGAFVDAGELIASEDAACEEKVAALQRKIEQTRADSRERVAGEHARQAQAALAIHEAGRNAAQVAELLELRSEKEARRLIAAGRTQAEQDTEDDASEQEDAADDRVPREPEVADADSETGSGEEAQLSGIDGQQHRPHADFVPSVIADGSRQSA